MSQQEGLQESGAGTFWPRLRYATSRVMLLSPHSRAAAQANKSEQSWKKKKHFSEPHDRKYGWVGFFFVTHVGNVLIFDEYVKTENSFLSECKVCASISMDGIDTFEKKKPSKRAALLAVPGNPGLKFYFAGSTKGQLASTKGQLACKAKKRFSVQIFSSTPTIKKIKYKWEKS